MLDSFKRVRKFLIANDAYTYSLSKKLKAASEIASRRIAKDAPGEKEDTGWRTTEGGKHYQINEEGKVVKGPNAMKGSNVNKPSTWKGGASGSSSGKAGETAKAKAPSIGNKVSKANMAAMRKSNSDMAATCRKKAKDWPDGSPERHIYEMYADTLSKPLSGRPTQEQSEALSKKYLANISSKLKPYAVDRYKKDIANEPKITSDICDIADEIGTGMFGLDFRLKKASDNSEGVCRIEEKIQKDMKEAKEKGKELTYEQAVDKLGDIVRYTQACTAENLVSNAEKTLAALEKKGYKVVKVKNTWETYNTDNPYRGVNCSIMSPTGTKFELQFHTAESLVTKEVQHGWYEEARTEGTPKARQDELNKRMYNNAQSMKAPTNIGRLKSITSS